MILFESFFFFPDEKETKNQESPMAIRTRLGVAADLRAHALFSACFYLNGMFLQGPASLE
jgi:hypothetical protein